LGGCGFGWGYGLFLRCWAEGGGCVGDIRREVLVALRGRRKRRFRLLSRFTDVHNAARFTGLQVYMALWVKRHFENVSQGHFSSGKSLYLGRCIVRQVLRLPFAISMTDKDLNRTSIFISNNSVETNFGRVGPGVIYSPPGRCWGHLRISKNRPSSFRRSCSFYCCNSLRSSLTVEDCQA
jgi:hypothetical protein